MKSTQIKIGINLELLLNADEFGTLRGAHAGYDALARAGYLVSCGAGYALTALGREARATIAKAQRGVA